MYGLDSCLRLLCIWTGCQWHRHFQSAFRLGRPRQKFTYIGILSYVCGSRSSAQSQVTSSAITLCNHNSNGRPLKETNMHCAGRVGYRSASLGRPTHEPSLGRLQASTGSTRDRPQTRERLLTELSGAVPLSRASDPLWRAVYRPPVLVKAEVPQHTSGLHFLPCGRAST